jgi:hypothetical protein
LAKCGQRYNAGDKYAVLDALFIKAHDFPERWLRGALLNALEAHRLYLDETLDQAFGIKRPTGKSLTKARRDAQVRDPVLFRYYDLHGKGAALDGALLAKVGAEFNMSASTVRRILNHPESRERREMLKRLPISECSNTAENVTSHKKPKI